MVSARKVLFHCSCSSLTSNPFTYCSRSLRTSSTSAFSIIQWEVQVPEGHDVIAVPRCVNTVIQCNEPIIAQIETADNGNDIKIFYPKGAKTHTKECVGSCGVMFHTDRGSQFTAKRFRQYLDQHDMIQSFSAKGYPYDNAVMECFFRYLKHEETD